MIPQKVIGCQIFLRKICITVKIYHILRFFVNNFPLGRFLFRIEIRPYNLASVSADSDLPILTRLRSGDLKLQTRDNVSLRDLPKTDRMSNFSVKKLAPGD